MFQRFWKKLPGHVFYSGISSIVAVIAIGTLAVLTFSPKPPTDNPPPFTITVDPAAKTIKVDEKIEEAFRSKNTLSASVATAAGTVFDWIALSVNSSPWYVNLANPPIRYVTIFPGYRKEQVANAFATQLSWSAAEKTAFLSSTVEDPPTIPEGRFQPATYELAPETDSLQVRSAIADRFQKEIVARYTPELEETVPLETALRIASIIEREAGSVSEMRTISGIIWNRLFIGMKLQMDATLQYAKGTQKNGWWPKVVPKDKYLKSTYNTYQYEGLPPTPIASPSVNAVEAALNPEKTDCYYYFHHRRIFYCSTTYDEHVATLIKKFGSGK